jgi:hypothetical protein
MQQRHNKDAAAAGAAHQRLGLTCCDLVLHSAAADAACSTLLGSAAVGVRDSNQGSVCTRAIGSNGRAELCAGPGWVDSHVGASPGLAGGGGAAGRAVNACAVCHNLQKRSRWMDQCLLMQDLHLVKAAEESVAVRFWGSLCETAVRASLQGRGFV